MKQEALVSHDLQFGTMEITVVGESDSTEAVFDRLIHHSAFTHF